MKRMIDQISGGGRLLIEEHGFNALVEQFKKGGTQDPRRAAMNYMNNDAREKIPGIDSMGPYEIHCAIRDGIVTGTISPAKEAKSMRKNATDALVSGGMLPAGLPHS